MLDILRSRTVQAILAVVGFCVFYAIGVMVRQHAGVSVVIRNESKESVHELSVGVGDQGDRRTLQDLVPGGQARVFVPAAEHSRIVMEFAQEGRQPRAVTVFDHAQPGDCGSSTVKILPHRSTESNETHRSACWNGWFDFM